MERSDFVSRFAVAVAYFREKCDSSNETKMKIAFDGAVKAGLTISIPDLRYAPMPLLGAILHVGLLYKKDQILNDDQRRGVDAMIDQGHKCCLKLQEARLKKAA